MAMTEARNLDPQTHPAVVAARAQQQPRLQRLAALHAELRRIEEAVNDNRLVTGPDTLSVAERRRAKVRETALYDELLLADADALEGEAAIDGALTLAREELAALVDADRVRLAAKLDKALGAAAAVNAELARADQEAERVLGRSVARYSWFELSDEPPLRASKLTAWRESLRALGVL